MSRFAAGGSCTFRGAMPPKGLGNNPGPDSAQPMERVIRKTAVQYVNVSGPALPVATTVVGYVRNPSPRLRLSLTVGWEFDVDQNVVVGPATPAWNIRNVRTAPGGGFVAQLDWLFVDTALAQANRPLPDGYEADTALREGQIYLYLTDGTGQDIQANTGANLIVEARWEPHDDFTDRGEMWALLQRADLSFPNAQLFGNGT